MSTPILSFTSLETVYVEGRGRIFVVIYPIGGLQKGQPLDIDGERWELVEVERQASQSSAATGERVGLVVRRPTCCASMANGCAGPMGARCSSGRARCW